MPAITLALGWRAAFIVTGLLTIVWLVAWLSVYRSPRQDKKVSPEELAFIESDPADPVEHTPWLSLLKVKETWAYALAKFLIDPIWWMFLFWLPDFFAKRHHLDLKSFGPPLVVVYVLSDLGSIAGGWMSSALIHSGRSVNVARKLSMLVSAICVLPIFAAAYVDNLWMATLLVGLATAAHQAFSCNLYTLPADVFPKAAVGSVVGIGGTAGAIGGMLMAEFAGYILDRVGSYAPIFAVAGSVYLIALLAIHLITPRYELAKVARN